MKKPILSLNNIRRSAKSLNANPDARESIRPDSIEKRGDKFFVKTKQIKFLNDLQMQIMFREKPTSTAFLNGIKEQNNKHHSEHFDDDIKQDIDDLCDQAIKDFEHLPMSELNKIINLLKLGYSLFNSNNQHIYPMVQYGKAHTELDSKRSQLTYDYDACWNHLIEMQKKGVKPHKLNAGLQDKFCMSRETFAPIVAKFRKQYM
jgi:hypothetical protein